MATKKRAFKTIPVGTKVSWHYRSAIGHGTVTGVSKMGSNADNTMYSVRETDHHPGEPAVVHHSGKALSRARVLPDARGEQFLPPATSWPTRGTAQQGWHRYVGGRGDALVADRCGASAPGETVMGEMVLRSKIYVNAF